MRLWPLVVCALAGSASAAESSPSADAPLLLLPVKGPAESAQAFEGELVAALRARLGATSVTTLSELNVALDAEKQRDLVGCDDVSCLNELLGALNGRLAAAVTLVPGEPLSSVTVIVRDLADATRSFRIERRAPSLNPARLHDLAADVARALCDSAGWSATSEVPAPSAGGGGTLKIESQPTGARVFLNLQDIGQTPLTLSGLSSGQYILTIERKGYHRLQQFVQLESAAAVSRNIELQRLRDWQAGIFFGVNPRAARRHGANATLTVVDAGIIYGRDLLGPLHVGGVVGYSNADVTGEGLQYDANHGFMLGAFVGATFAVKAGAVVQAAEEAESPGQQSMIGQAIEESNVDFGLLWFRPRIGVSYRTPAFVRGEIGAEIGFVGFFGTYVYWSPLIGSATGLGVSEAARSSMGVRITLGWSQFFAAPD